MFGNTSRVSLVGVFVLFALMFAANGVAASPLEDIPEALTEWLGLSSTYMAEQILSGIILVSVALALAAAAAPPQVNVLVIIVLMAVLTGMGWLDTWVLVLICLLTVALFGRQIVQGGRDLLPGG